MRHHRVFGLLFGPLLFLSAGGGGAEGLSTFESIAFQDFTVTICSRNEPSRASEFVKLLSPPYVCEKQVPAIIDQARKSHEYRALNIRLAKEMGALSKEQVTDMCNSLFKVKC